jgi:hypothetical protein
LALKRLRLYETGVGYFERSGKLPGGADVTLPVPAAHVDDALKTLVVVGKDGQASVSGIEFDSVVSKGMARALAGLPADAEQPVDYRGVLGSLKGSAVRVRLEGDEFEGRLLDVFDAPAPKEMRADKKKSKDDDEGEGEETPAAAGDPWLLLQTDSGEIRRIHTSHVLGLKPLDPALVDRIDDAAGTLGVRAARSRRTLRVLASSQHLVTLGYISEVPVWRSSYRLVVAQGGKQAMLQGWALMHNDTDEAWRGVQVELVSGRPDSFLFPLAAPRYTRRPLAEPAEELSTVPQLVDKTPDQIWGDHLGAGGLGLSGVGSGGGGYGQGFGSGYGRSPSMRMGSTSVSGRVGESSELAIGILAAIAPAEGVENGALFNYALPSAIDLRAHGSTLVPFFGRRVPIRRITRFASASSPGRSALSVTNGTRQTLPAGTIAIYESGAFAGESALDRLKPTQRSFLEFGLDLDVELELEKTKSKEIPQRLAFEHDNLVVHFVRQRDEHYSVVNRSGERRTVMLGLNVVNNAKVEGASELDYDTAQGKPQAVFLAKPRARSSYSLAIAEALSRRLPTKSLESDQLRELLAADTLPAVDRARLEKAVAKVERVEAIRQEQLDAKAEKASVEEDLERLRKHLSALGDKSGSPAGGNPLVTRILSAEDALSAIRKKLKELVARESSELSAVSSELSPLGKDRSEQVVSTTP